MLKKLARNSDASSATAKAATENLETISRIEILRGLEMLLASILSLLDIIWVVVAAARRRSSVPDC